MGFDEMGFIGGLFLKLTGKEFVIEELIFIFKLAKGKCWDYLYS